MTEVETATLAAEDGSGRREYVDISVTGEHPYELTLHRSKVPAEQFQGDNLFACLLLLRKRLEADGLLLCCQGARLDVTNSGMQKQMTGGKYVYTFNPETRTVNQDTVYILDPAPYGKVSTVAEQRAAIFALFGLEDRKGDG